MSRKNRGGIETDVLIAGGGLVGLSLAAALAAIPVRVAVVESTAPERFGDARFDGRVSALARGSVHMFSALGLWEAMRGEAGAIRDIRVTDGDSPLFLHYDCRDAGGEPLGHIVENRVIRRVLLAHAENHPMIRLISPASCLEVVRGPHFVNAALDSGAHVRAKLAVAAEGRHSPLRGLAEIGLRRWDYRQTGIVCTVRHERPHRETAVERFLPAGPFAILPMRDPHLSSLVWTEPSHVAPHYMAMPEEELSAQIASRFGGYLGAVSATGPRWSYPLSLALAERYTATRLCLAGDAAHAIHPIAGQGFNLGLRDVAALADIVRDTARLGGDIGGGAMLEKYEDQRRGDAMPMVAITDALNRLFSNDVAPVSMARRLGLASVNNMPGLRKFFMRHAMGLKN